MKQQEKMVLLFGYKAAISGLVIAFAAYVSDKWPTFGALIVSLPLVSLLVMFWMWQGGIETEKIAIHAESTFWLVLPGLPMFLILPVMLRNGWNFLPAIGVLSIGTIILYFVMVYIMKLFGLEIL
jgi:hypothetical protein